MDYDIYTGEESIETLFEKQQEQAKEVQAEADEFVSLSKHPAWKKIIAAIKEEMETDVERVLYSRDPQCTMVYQERAKARRDFLKFLEMKVAESGHQVEEQKAQA